MSKFPPLTAKELKSAIANETKGFEQAIRWIEEHMPPKFLDEVDGNTRIIIARNLLSYASQDKFTPIYLKHQVIILCQDSPHVDLRILKDYSEYGIYYYRTFVSNEPPPREKKGNLRIAILHFRNLGAEDKLSPKKRKEVSKIIREQNPECSDSDTDCLIGNLGYSFLNSLTQERLQIALNLLFRARKEDRCQYETRMNEDWKERDAPSLQLIIAWKDVPQAGFLYLLAESIFRHELVMQKVVATYINPHSPDSILVLSLGLHGIHGKAAWEEADIDDLLREITLLKYFNTNDEIHSIFVQKGILSGNEAHLIRNMVSFVHQALVHANPYLYSYDNILEGFCRHPELSAQLCKLFSAKFHPEKRDLKQLEEKRVKFQKEVEKIDTGQPNNDVRRKHILSQGLSFIDWTLKTNFYQENKCSFSFRLDPSYLDGVPYDRREKFPELPYGIFFIRGMHFIGFNIRFRDLARGGVRTVLPEWREQFVGERNSIFSEAYNLAFTQQKKNKDIPEGGAKTAILLEPLDVFISEENIFRRELEEDGTSPAVLEEKLKIYRRNLRSSYIFSSLRYFIEGFMTLINCEEDGKLKDKSIVDYWMRPEYIYLGPDENMFNNMIVWLADYAVKCDYKPGRSFMSSKPGAGINHKEFGITSYGLNVYVEELLKYLKIDPKKEIFTVKISGGPDGDVAGNEILNLNKFYPKTAKLLAITDVSGTIYDPNGLDLPSLAILYEKALPIRFYPIEKFSDGAFLLDVKTRKDQLTLLHRKTGNKIEEIWLSPNEMNHLYRTNVHQVKADLFIPCGGRPRTLSDASAYLDDSGKPTSKGIVEGANLYLTQEARRGLENLGVLIMKDSSCNKGGVMCSSFEVLSGLCMSEADFIKEKLEYVKEVLEIIRVASLNEARLLIDTHKKTDQPMTEISEEISKKINLYKDQLLDHFEQMELPKKGPLIDALFEYCPPLLRKRYASGIMSMPEIHKKAILAAHLAAQTIYKRGLEWNGTVEDLLKL